MSKRSPLSMNLYFSFIFHRHICCANRFLYVNGRSLFPLYFLFQQISFQMDVNILKRLVFISRYILFQFITRTLPYFIIEPVTVFFILLKWRLFLTPHKIYCNILFKYWQLYWLTSWRIQKWRFSKTESLTKWRIKKWIKCG